MKTVVNSRFLGIGHAMCDISAELDVQTWNAFRAAFSWLASGAPVHLDAAQAHGVFSYLEERAAQGQGNISYAAGGSALNAVRVASLLGTKAAFAGCVGNDECGDVIRAGLKSAGVEALLDTSGGQGSTGMFCTVSPMTETVSGQNATEEAVSERIIIASPSVARRVRDLDFDGFDVEKVELIHAEGLLADSPRNLEQLFQRAHRMKKMISIDVVSSEAARRNKDTLKRLIQSYADFVFCNKSEFEALDVNIANYRSDIVWVIKADRAGVDCFASGQRIHADAPQCTVVDDLGAGDAFAGAFLSGMLVGLPVDRCLQLGTKAAACALQSRGTEPDEHCLRALSQDILAE
ncbi:putative Adenosine kinase [uncultured spirochete]|uniref:Putative Adenosine kinase n=1 Tax=uncultured spirochete TaxID=156406 RepID=A0A3P3XU20_9SPIR|nr:putative Adenosine kinase [uncultured spirochete]